MIKTGSSKPWHNWARTATSQPASIFYPSTIHEVQEIVIRAATTGNTIRVVGAGHSFTPLVKTNDWLISLDRLSGVETINEQENTVTVLAGTRLFALGKILGEAGYSQENLGDINIQSIAGAISTGTHGTGISFGSISTQVKELTIITASGELICISETKLPHYFKAALVSLGSLGIIVKAKLSIIKSPVYEFTSRKITYQQLNHQLDQLIQENRHFEFFLFPYSDIVQVKTMNIKESKPKNVRLHHFKNVLLENYLFYIISETCRHFPKTSRFFSRLSAKSVSSTIITAQSHQLFATPRMVRFREMEYGIPLEHFRSALKEIRECIGSQKFHVHFPIECRTVKGDDIWLSPSYDRDTAYIAFHMYKGMPYEKYFFEMERIMKKYNGRPHWGKMHNRNPQELHELYPKLAGFLSIRKELDPHGMFLNDYLTGLFEIEERKNNIQQDNENRLFSQ